MNVCFSVKNQIIGVKNDYMQNRSIWDSECNKIGKIDK